MLLLFVQSQEVSLVATWAGSICYRFVPYDGRA